MPRVKTYVGPKVQIQPAELARYEQTGLYVAEEKHDGHWAEVTLGADGKIARIVGRSGTVFEGQNVAGLMGLSVGLPYSVLIAELEAGTEAANNRNVSLGHRRLWVFDVVKLLGQDTVKLSYEQRRALLEQAFAQVIGASSHIKLVRQSKDGFSKLFSEIDAAEGEGLVLKRLGRSYGRNAGNDGKTDDWIRCKRFRYVDYVVMSIGKSDGGSPNFQVGLYVAGKLQRVATIKNIPRGLDYNSLVGQVIECKGVEVHSSGALRHGHYERTRTDKDPKECTLQAALEA